MSTQMKSFSAKSAAASHLRRRKYALARRFGLPQNLLGGCLSQTHRRCGRSNCHCASGEGHPLWSITFSRHGKHRVERVPPLFLDEVEQAVLETQDYLDAIKEIMEINLELLALTRSQAQQKKVRASQKKRHGRPRAGKKRSTFRSGSRS